MPSHDDPGEGLLAPLRELFDALDATLERVADGSGELTGSSAVLAVLRNHLRPALDQELSDAQVSSAATWHLAHLASDMIASVGLPTGRGTPSQPVRDANKRLIAALAAARERQGDGGSDLDELRALILGVPPKVVVPLEEALLTHHDESLAAIAGLGQAVQAVAPAVLSPLETMLMAQHGETVGKLGDVQTAVGNVVPGLLVPLTTTLAAQHGETLGKLTALDGETDQLEGLIEELPQKLAEVLLKNLPDIVRNVMIAIKTPVASLPPVVTPEHFATLDDLAEAQPGDYTDTAADRLGLLQGALEVLDRDGPVRPSLLPPIGNLIVTVLNFSDPANPLTISELDLMNRLMNEISPFLQAPAVPGVK